MTKFILVRHGETEWNKERRIQGSASDTPLSPTGLNQAEQLALKLKTDPVQAIFSSPLQRALDTAKAIAQYHNLEVRVLPELKEINVGELEGQLSLTLAKRFDEFVCRNGQNDEGWIKLPGGESVNEVQTRAWEAIQNMAHQYPEGTVVVVSHYFVIMSIVCRILNLPLNNMVHLRLSTGTVSIFTLDGKEDTRLELFNDSCHHRK